MKFTDQPTPASCYRACVASIFGIDVNEVPRGCDGDSWNWDDFQEWLQSRFGMQAIEVWIGGDAPVLYPAPAGVPCILSGQSPRRDTLHAVVARSMGLEGFEILHDPHPDRAGFVGEPTHVTFFALLSPTGFGPCRHGAELDQCQVQGCFNSCLPCRPGAHIWKRQRVGGPPDMAESLEVVEFCTVCGMENLE